MLRYITLVIRVAGVNGAGRKVCYQKHSSLLIQFTFPISYIQSLSQAAEISSSPAPVLFHFMSPHSQHRPFHLPKNIPNSVQDVNFRIKKQTITTRDVIYALKQLGSPMYGFGHFEIDVPRPKMERERVRSGNELRRRLPFK